jgi:hypothetical protein
LYFFVSCLGLRYDLFLTAGTPRGARLLLLLMLASSFQRTSPGLSPASFLRAENGCKIRTFILIGKHFFQLFFKNFSFG